MDELHNQNTPSEAEEESTNQETFGRREFRVGLIADIAGFVGAFLIVIGAVWLRFRPGETTVAYSIAGAGAAFFLFYAGYYLVRWLHDPRWTELAQILIYSIVVLAIIIGLNFIAYRNKKEWDLTAEKIHTLSPETLTALKQIKDDVKIVVFVHEGHPQKQRLARLTKRYADKSPHIKTEIVDPLRDPIRAISYGVSGEGPSAYVEQGERRLSAGTADEQGITNAILRVLKPPQTVCFTSGHKEKDPKQGDDEGYSQIARFFSDKNYQVVTVSLLQKGKVPDDCGVLVIAGPRTPFLDPEIKALQDYLSKDEARLLVALDPFTDAGLDGILTNWGIKINPNLFVVDPETHYGNPVFIIFGGSGVGFSQESEITRGFGDQGIIFPLSTPIITEKPPGEDIKVIPILKSMPSSWAQSEKKQLAYQQARGDLKGPLNVGVSIEDGNRRIVVLGDSDFANNSIVQRLTANQDLALNMVRWLVKQEELITLTKKETKSETLTLSRSASRFILFYAIFLLPGVFAGFGILVWWRRRAR
ncbi:MAG: GldG family protein [bacterium JZ-2024 1]